MLTFSYLEGWGKTDFEFDYESYRDSDRAYHAAGFRQACGTPENVQDHFFSAVIYAFSPTRDCDACEFEYMVILEVGDQLKKIMIPDLPSLVEFLPKISMVNMCSMMKEKESDRCADILESELSKVRR